MFKNNKKLFKNISKIGSIQYYSGLLIKKCLSKIINKNIFLISIAPCADKKLESSLISKKCQNVDFVMTTA